MPFIENKRRKPLLKGTLKPKVPGDLCFLEYVKLVKAWKENPRWTTAHNLYKQRFFESKQSLDVMVAWDLAWQVFFEFYVLPYEREKAKENGGI